MMGWRLDVKSIFILNLTEIYQYVVIFLPVNDTEYEGVFLEKATITNSD